MINTKERKYTMKPFIALLILLTVPMVFAGTGAKVGFSFLKIGVDARAAAMGDAYTSISSDASAAFWNPAGLAGSEVKSVILMHNAWLQDINHEYAAIHFLNGNHNLAISLNMISITGIELRGETASDIPQGNTQALNTYVGLAYATIVFTDWQIGMQVKYLYEKYYLNSADGFALDLGIQKTNIISDLSWAAVIQNLGKMSVLKDEETRLPFLLRTGISYYLPWQLLEKRLLLAADIVHVIDDITSYNMGMEIGVYKNIDLRVGYIIGRDSQSFTGGFGMRYDIFRFAYAFAPISYDLGDSHRFSLVIDF
jgi:hypothetical protein